ncbi:hypothetical protein Pyn_12990 [Prunus yedoensis var. nudiflora]|uniref:Uncharacterized protein n=1 Tax=Prunus yedoensis var. nudiflora TaxID=2094558 RepID=A0A314XWC2_PRUYE|nr:hypothetical protein Pyn_12990 [Prunus yedoensis var. nudiflora]
MAGGEILGQTPDSQEDNIRIDNPLPDSASANHGVFDASHSTRSPSYPCIPDLNLFADDMEADFQGLLPIIPYCDRGPENINSLRVDFLSQDVHAINLIGTPVCSPNRGTMERYEDLAIGPAHGPVPSKTGMLESGNNDLNDGTLQLIRRLGLNLATGNVQQSM